jgi:hypothetical protein
MMLSGRKMLKLLDLFMANMAAAISNEGAE